ncbi:MAG: response regulator transcription factor [Steroidobacteraceae bacterium]
MRAGDRLLIVEDDVTAASLLARAMGRQGYLVETAASVQEALELSAAGALAAAIVDLRLERDSGLRLLPELVNSHPGIRVLVLTGYASITTAVQAIKMGATDYLAKPVGVSEILAALGCERMHAPDDPPLCRPSVRRFEWEYIQKILAEHAGNISKTARTLGMARRTLQRKLSKRPTRT